MLYVLLVGLLKENKLIQKHGVSNFKTGALVMVSQSRDVAKGAWVLAAATSSTIEGATNWATKYFKLKKYRRLTKILISEPSIRKTINNCAF
jgi:hypothetical protein